MNHKSDTYENKILEILQNNRISDPGDDLRAIYAINDVFSEEIRKTKEFARALIRALCQRCLYLHGVIDNQFFEKRIRILRLYLHKDDNLELEYLFALQDLFYKKRLNPGLFIKY
jgi:hypothetical protein